MFPGWFSSHHAQFTTRGFPKMVGKPNKPMGCFLLKMDHDLGCDMGKPTIFLETPIILYHSESTNYIFMGWNHQPEELRGSTFPQRWWSTPDFWEWRAIRWPSSEFRWLWYIVFGILLLKNGMSNFALFMDLTPNGTKFQSLGPYSWIHMKHPLGSGSREAKINPKWQVLFLSRYVKMSYWHGLL